MRSKGDISYDVCYFEVIERCMNDEQNIQLVTADLIMDFLFAQPYN